MKEVHLKITSDDGSEESITLNFNDKEIDTLEKYSRNCVRLEKAKLNESFPKIEGISWEKGSDLKFNISEFKYSEVCELLHLARPIFLHKEIASFNKTKSIIGKKSKDTTLANHLKNIGNIYEKGDYQPYYQVTYGDTPLFHDSTLKVWLNGIEYHQDEEKAAIIRELEEGLSENVTRGIFVSQLSGRIRATFLLEHLVKLIIKG